MLADRGILRADAALVLGITAVVVGALAARGPRSRAGLALVTALAAGAFALGARFDAADRARPLQVAEFTVEATVQRTDRSPQWMRVELEDVVAVGAAATPVPRRVTLLDRPSPPDAASLESALPGERIRARVRLRAPRGLRNPGSRDAAERARRAGVGAVGRLVHPSLHARLPGREGLRPLAALDEMRARANRRLERDTNIEVPIDRKRELAQRYAKTHSAGLDIGLLEGPKFVEACLQRIVLEAFERKSLGVRENAARQLGGIDRGALALYIDTRIDPVADKDSHRVFKCFASHNVARFDVLFQQLKDCRARAAAFVDFVRVLGWNRCTYWTFRRD